MLHGGKRVEEIFVTYPENLMGNIREYLGDRFNFLFVTRKGEKVSNTQLNRTYGKAGKKAKIPFKVTPHVLRATFVTHLKSQGFTDSDIVNHLSL